MTAVFCFSAAGHSLAVAAYFADRLGVPVRELEDLMPCNTAVVVFPVYCENVPEPVRAFLPRLAAENVVLIATYGKMWHGNVLADAAKLVCGRVIAGAYVPTGHTYRSEGTEFDAHGLEVIFDRITHPQPAVLPGQRKHLWADIFPAWRSRMGVDLVRNENCNGCGLCRRNCPFHTCNRCLRCVVHCPRGALTFRLHPLMRRYLARPREDRLKIYL